MENIRQCIICGNPGILIYQGIRDSHFATEGLFSIKKCSHCDLLWLDPRPTSFEIQKYYKDFFKQPPSKYSALYSRRFLGSLRELMRKAILCGYYGYRHLHKKHTFCKLGNLLGKIPFFRSRAAYSSGEAFPFYDKTLGLILDVGCGKGEYLALLKDMGFKVMGIEPSHAAATIAKNKGLTIQEGTLKEANLADASVDQITMLHVIEHVFDPLAEIAECFRVLKDKGRLIVHTPNADSLGRSLFQKNWYNLDPPRHLFIFTPKSLRLIFKKNNFKSFKIRTLTSRSLTMFDNSAIIAKNGRLDAENIRPQKGRFLFAIKELILCHLGKECGEEIELIAVK